MGFKSRNQLLALSTREYNRQAEVPGATPAPQRFRGLRMSLTKFDASWDRKRGAAARLMGVLLRENDQQLQERVCADAPSSRTYTGVADWLSSEARYLRKVATQMDTAAGRLSVVLDRCRAEQSVGVPISGAQQ